MMKSNVEADAAATGPYHCNGIMAPAMSANEPMQVVYNRTQKRVPVFRDSLIMYEQQMVQVMEELRTLTMDVNALRVHYEEALQEKLYIENLAAQAEKRVQDVKEIVDRYVGVKDAVVASDGFTYERETISSYIEGCKEAGGTPTSYQTEKPLTSLLIPNRSLKTLVDRLVTLQKAEPTPPAPADRNPVQHHSKSITAGRAGNISINQHEGQRRNMHGGGKDSSGPVELNAKGERVHPCIRVYGYCNYNESCAYAKYPYDACLSNLKNKCRFKNQCHERHVEFRGPLDDYGNCASTNQGPNQENIASEPVGEANK
ncbi:putative RNA binding protein [Leishmania major strain Friedlin]|uniref:Putative RNA binding protein n=1 Tax=Leishmania major TaxID=5664 RepID=Q4QDJ1_LEIMA|nr:putative RNA binding protein [Leishmania major strain Friedlin]CAG9572716.1 CSBPA/ZC3H39/RNA_binding_protein [Leishmania major strain Friedlin]CAJ07115.1 putative RNA binding protein [Leishmania major strain Friedlin]|eukprot:XP_001682607.1 putative RNA binding protein [Leishmania major strain Friedlin]